MLPISHPSLRTLIFTLLFSAISLPAHAGWFDWLFKDTYTETRYPIVLNHGMFGLDTIAGYSYWYRIPEELRRSGAEVYVSQVAAVNNTEERGEQLARQVEAILAATGADKVNLIGHSHGGPTVRYVASVYPDYVASATSIAGPNTGARIFDLKLEIEEVLPLYGKVTDNAINAFATLIDLISTGGYEQDFATGGYSVSTPGMREFNIHHPAGLPQTACGHGPELADNGVRYYSWSGANPLTNVLDLSDGILAITALLYPGEKNDGLVSSCSSHLGMVIRDDYHMNHFDEINQFAGLVSPFETNPTTVFRQHANRLKNRGL